MLAAAYWTKPHMILLDEPTNYLDMETLAALTQALKTFRGGVVVITHNEPFRKELCDEEWLLEDGKLTITKNKDAKSVFQKGAKANDGDAA